MLIGLKQTYFWYIGAYIKQSMLLYIIALTASSSRSRIDGYATIDIIDVLI